MDNAPALATAADSSDPRTGLRAIAALRRLLEQLEALQVDNAREHGWSWQEIAEILGVSRQAVHKKHARRARVPEESVERTLDRTAPLGNPLKGEATSEDAEALAAIGIDPAQARQRVLDELRHASA